MHEKTWQRPPLVSHGSVLWLPRPGRRNGSEPRPFEGDLVPSHTSHPAHVGPQELHEYPNRRARARVRGRTSMYMSARSKCACSKSAPKSATYGMSTTRFKKLRALGACFERCRHSAIPTKAETSSGLDRTKSEKKAEAASMLSLDFWASFVYARRMSRRRDWTRTGISWARYHQLFWTIITITHTHRHNGS